MSRTNRRHNRQIERHRRNKGPEMLSQAADNELREKADAMVAGLSQATIESGNAAAAGLLLALAETAHQNDNAALDHAVSLAERWAKEPQLVETDTAARLLCTPERLALTDGRPQDDTTELTKRNAPDSSEIIDAEWEMVPTAPAPEGRSVSG